jgi:hypothetical protein
MEAAMRLRRGVGYLRRHHLALIALMVALGGSAYAGTKINGSQIVDRSISGSKVKKNTLTGAEIKESKLSLIQGRGRAVSGQKDIVAGDPNDTILKIPGFGQLIGQCAVGNLGFLYANTTSSHTLEVWTEISGISGAGYLSHGPGEIGGTGIGNTAGNTLVTHVFISTVGAKGIATATVTAQRVASTCHFRAQALISK